MGNVSGKPTLSRQHKRIIIGLSAGLLVMLVIAVFAIVQWRRAEQKSKIALSSQLAAQAKNLLITGDSSQEAALLLAIQSMRLYPSGEAAQILHEISIETQLPRMTWPTDREAWEYFIFTLCISPNGKYVVSASRDHTARVWDAITGEEIARLTHEGWVGTVAVSPDSKYAVSGGFSNIVRVWELSSGLEVFNVTHENGNYISFVTFSPDGKYVASSAAYDETIHLWDAKTGGEVSHMTHDDDTMAIVAFSPDSQYMVSSGGRDSTARVWDTSTGQEIARMKHDGFLSTVAFSPDGEYVASGGGFTARVWEADTGQEISRMTHGSYVYFVSFSPDGKHVASGGRDNTALVWNTQTGEEIARLPHGDFIGFIAFSPDGAYVLTTESSGTSSQSIAHVWGATTGQEIFRMVHNGGKFSVEFSPDGEHIVSTSEKGDAIIVQHYLPGDLIDDACMHVTRNLTIAEWRKYIGSALPYQAICPNAPLIPVPTAVTATVPTPYSTTTP